jgi:hypothetical protein
VDAPRSFRHRHALHAVDARFEFQLGVGALAFDREHRFLHAAKIAVAQRQKLGLPALQLCVAGVHLEQLAGEERRFLATRSGADFDDRARGIRRVLRQQEKLHVALKRAEALAQAAGFLIGQRFQLGIGPRVVE